MVTVTVAVVWWRRTVRGSGVQLNTIALVTTRGYALMKRVHNELKGKPVTLTGGLAQAWMDSYIDESSLLEIATVRFPAGRKEDREALWSIEPFDYEGFPPIHL